jgi:hypothetical protein
MKATKRLVAAGALAALSLGLLGCGDKQQTAGTRKGDAQPYTTATGTHTAAGWKAGDAVSWEKQLTTRTQNGQNEYIRTGQR